MSKRYKEQYIKDHRYMGFDEIAFNLKTDKEEVKTIWNKLKLGYHLTPTTLIDFRWLSEDKYEIAKDIVVFIAPATPIVLYKGSLTDFASIPKLFHILIDKDDNAIALASLVHDALYKSEWVSRGVADGILIMLMKYRQAPLWKRWLVYAGVRMGGWVVWLHHNRKEVMHQKRAMLQAIKRYNKNITYNI